MTSAAALRPSVIRLAVKDLPELQASFISLFTSGGLFIPTPREYRLGDDIYVLLSLPQDKQSYPIAGTVAWVTPARAVNGRPQGIGFRFPNDEKSVQLRARMEDMLNAVPANERVTYAC
jgi:type IV pilus assembly protein PilZ